jgi:hypothetical protein
MTNYDDELSSTYFKLWTARMDGNKTDYTLDDLQQIHGTLCMVKDEIDEVLTKLENDMELK